MSPDDKTPAFGVPRHTGDALLDDRSSNAEPDSDLIPEAGLNVLDAYHHELGLLAAETPREHTPEEQAALEELYAKTQETMARSPEEVRAQLRAAGRVPWSSKSSA